MKIGIFSDSYMPYISGVTTSLFMLAEGLIKEGHEVYIITATGKGYKEFDKDYPYIIRFKGVPFPKKGLRAFRMIAYNQSHIKRILELDLDVMHVHSEFSIGNMAIHMRDNYKIPMVYTTHTMYEEYPHYVSKLAAKLFRKSFMKGLKSLMRRYILRADVTITPSQKIKDLMLSYNIPGNYEIVPTGINLKKFRRSTYKEEEIKALKDSLGLKDDEFVCLFVGRISAEKSIEVLIDGFYHANNEKMKFVIVGDGPHKSNLESMVKKLYLEDKIIFTGQVDWDKVGIYYQIGDCFLNASVSETQGLTYIEALASGTAVIVKYDKVLESVVEHGYNGLFFHENSELPELINSISLDPSITETLKQNASLSVEKYSQEGYVNNALKTYEKAIRLTEKEKALELSSITKKNIKE